MQSEAGYLRIRATAKPIITSTPKITSARFTGSAIQAEENFYLR